MKINLALVSPSGESYSETFILAQKQLLPFNTFYYYGGNLPIKIEGQPDLNSRSLFRKSLHKVKSKMGLESLSYAETQLKKSFRKNHINVVLAQYGPTGEGLVNICNDLQIPLIVHFHGYDSSHHVVLERHKYYEKIFTHASKIIAVSKSMQSRLLEFGCPADKLSHINYGPKDCFSEVNTNYSDPLLIGIGRFVDKKAPYYTILAFSKVLDIFPESKLILAGDGPLYNVCRNMVKYLGIESSVTLPGIIAQGQFIDYALKATAFVQHSIEALDGDVEGTPVAILEASAMGLPVIATRHEGITDVIKDEVSGLLIDEHDVDGMANAMKKLLGDKNYSMKLGMAGKKNIKDQNSMSHYIFKLSSEIEEAGKLKFK